MCPPLHPAGAGLSPDKGPWWAARAPWHPRQRGKTARESPWILPSCSRALWPSEPHKATPASSGGDLPQNQGVGTGPEMGGGITGPASASAAAGPLPSSQASPSAHPYTHSPSACMCHPWHSRWPPVRRTRVTLREAQGKQELLKAFDGRWGQTHRRGKRAEPPHPHPAKSPAYRGSKPWDAKGSEHQVLTHVSYSCRKTGWLLKGWCCHLYSRDPITSLPTERFIFTKFRLNLNTQNDGVRRWGLWEVVRS